MILTSWIYWANALCQGLYYPVVDDQSHSEGGGLYRVKFLQFKFWKKIFCATYLVLLRICTGIC